MEEFTYLLCSEALHVEAEQRQSSRTQLNVNGGHSLQTYNTGGNPSLKL